MPRSRRTFKTERERTWVNSLYHFIWRIDLRITRMKEKVGAARFSESGICVERARIGGKVGFSGELLRIHIDRDDHRCTLRACCADERGVTSVERPHRGDEADRSRRLLKCGGELGAALDALHHYIDASAARSSSLAVRLCAVLGKAPAATSARHFVSPASA